MAEEYMNKNKEERVADMTDAKTEGDRWDIEINYGYGWEVETSEYTREDAIRSLQEYKENVQKYGKGVVRMTEHRDKDTKEEMIETNMGKMPLKDYLDIKAQQYGFDSYEDLKAEGLSISIDPKYKTESSKEEQKEEQKNKDTNARNKRKFLQGNSR